MDPRINEKITLAIEWIKGIIPNVIKDNVVIVLSHCTEDD